MSFKKGDRIICKRSVGQFAGYGDRIGTIAENDDSWIYVNWNDGGFIALHRNGDDRDCNANVDEFVSLLDLYGQVKGPMKHIPQLDGWLKKIKINSVST